MKALAVIALLAAGTTAQAEQTQRLDVGLNCASVVSFTLTDTVDAGEGWTRAFVGESLDHGQSAFAHRIWDVNCADAKVVQVGRGENLAEARALSATLSTGQGKRPEIYCVRDPKLPTAATAICEHQANKKAEGTK